LGGAIGANKSGGFGDEFLRGLLVGGAIGAVVGGAVGFSAPGFAADIIHFVNGVGSTFGASSLLSAGASSVLVPILIAGGGSIAASAGVFAYFCSATEGGPCLFAGANPFVKDSTKDFPRLSSLTYATAPMAN
jgi:hypothetical protein